MFPIGEIPDDLSRAERERVADVTHRALRQRRAGRAAAEESG